HPYRRPGRPPRPPTPSTGTATPPPRLIARHLPARGAERSARDPATARRRVDRRPRPPIEPEPTGGALALLAHPLRPPSPPRLRVLRRLPLPRPAAAPAARP